MDDVWKQEERLFLHLGGEREIGGSGRRYFSRGSVKYALLELLTQENMHGYQMMKALEEESGGTYQPSAGSIYPTLQMLRDQGFVEASKVEGKKVFRITDEGRTYLQAEKERPESSGGGELNEGEHGQPNEAERRGGGEEIRKNRRLTPKGKELLHLLKAAERISLSDGNKAARFRVLLEELKESLTLLVGDEQPKTPEKNAENGSL